MYKFVYIFCKCKIRLLANKFFIYKVLTPIMPATSYAHINKYRRFFSEIVYIRILLNPDIQNPYMDNPHMDDPAMENHTQINTK